LKGYKLSPGGDFIVSTMQHINAKHTHTTEIVDHFFRHEHARVIAILTKSFGPEHFERIEDAVQEAMIKAMQSWPYSGVPDNPSGWMLRVAKNTLLDQLRRKQNFNSKEQDIAHTIDVVSQPNETLLSDEIEDSLLKMMFACCHPSISVESQIILSLKVLCGFGNGEIARALLKSEDAIAKAYTRARKKFQENVKQLEVPLGDELNERLSSVLKTIYLLFNEGYNRYEGEQLINKDLCLEAMRLTQILVNNVPESTGMPDAMLALMCFHASRFETRLDREGNLLTLKDQNRQLWNAPLIEQGQYHLNRATDAESVTEYHLQASIAAHHCVASTYEQTNWANILKLYDALIELRPGRITQLNRLVALAKVHGEKKALQELTELENENPMFTYYLLHAIKADFMVELGMKDEAVKQLNKAKSLTKNQLEQKYLEIKINALT